MAITTKILAGDVADMIGGDFVDYDKVYLWIEWNLEDGQAVVDTANNKIRLGSSNITVNSDGTWSRIGLITFDSADVQPTGLLYRVHWQYPDDHVTGGRATGDSGWLQLMNADPDTVQLTAAMVVDYVPASWMTDAIATLQTYVDAGLAAEAGAEAAQAAAEAAITGLGIGTTTTGAPGTPAAVTLTGTAPDRDFNFTIPEGEQGLPGPGSAAWAPAQAVTVGSVRQATDGSWIKSTANRTTGATFDATEQTFWTPLSAYPGTIEQLFQSATFVATSATAALQPAMKKIRQAIEDVNILCLGDSIDAGYTNWFGRLAQWLAVQHPTWTVKYRDWDSTVTQAWASWSTVQTGTNGRTIWLSNGSVGGQTTRYPLGNRMRPMVGDVQPDVTFVAYNANFDFDTATTAYQIWDNHAALCEELLLYAAQTSIVVIGKPGKPLTPNAVEYRNDRLRNYVKSKGFGYLDVYQAFVDADPNWATALIQGDQIHPTTTQNATPPSGQDVYLAEVTKHFVYQAGLQLNSQKPSSFAEPIPASANLLVNGDFSDWTGDLPNGWAGSNAVATKDTTWLETGTYGLKLTSIVADTAAYLTQTIDAIAQGLRGQWITVAGRVRTDETLTHRNSNGLVKVGDSVNPTAVGETACTAGAVTTTDGYKWNVVSLRVANTATLVTIFLMNQLGGAADHATYDRIIVVRGRMPKDIRPVNQPISVSGIAGRVRKMISGRYYGPSQAVPTGANRADGTLYAVPFWVPEGGVTVSELACEVTSASGGAVGLRLGIYSSDSSDMPSKLVLDAGTTSSDGTSTGVKSVTGLSQKLSKGLYWLTFVAQGGIVGIRTVGSVGLDPVAATTFTGAGATASSSCYVMGSVSGALPATFVSVGADVLGPLVKIKAA